VRLTERDRRIILILVPIVVLVAYWFLLFSPKRDELKTGRNQQHQAEQARDQAVAQAAQLAHARETFAADYAEIVRLGKAIPETVDAPSLLVQLDRASHGTHIDFGSVVFGARASASVPAAAPTTQGPEQPDGNAAAGGAKAVTGPGRVVESAGNTVNTANQASSNVDQASGGSTSTTTTPTGAAPATTNSALDTVALTFNFTGTYFDLANFFHRLKRFVNVTNNRILVHGRLMTIDSLTFAPSAPNSTGPTSSKLTASVGATVYLAPNAQGTSAGATPQGPAATSTATTPTTTPAGSQTSSVPLATAGVR
jgi:Tfp pilus assembly protein PilO